MLNFDDAQDYELPPPTKPFEEEQRPALAQLILESVQDASPALQDWCEKVVPSLLGIFALHTAKGMSLHGANEATKKISYKSEESRQKAIESLAALPDQSLATHTLNAALGGWTVVELAELSDLEQRLYLAGVTMHDLNKMLGFGVELRLQGEQREDYEHVLRAWGARLGLWQFIEERYWEDVAFLAQNAEDVRGENRTLANYQNLQDDTDLEFLSYFVRLADLLASAAKRPDDLLDMRGFDKVKDLIRRVLDRRYELRYHRTADNRGLLTQVIHNAVLEQAHELGWRPFLYFPDGVTYLAPKGTDAPDIQRVPARVRHMLIDSVADKLGQLVSRAPTGLRFKPEFIQLLTPQRAANIAIQRIFDVIHDKKVPVTGDRKAKTTLRKGSSVNLDFDYRASLNADRLAEGLFGISKIIFEYYGGNREAHGEALLEALGLNDWVDAFRSIEFTGGVGYPWYYVAGHYLKRNLGLDAAQLERTMQEATQQVLTELGEPERQPPFKFLDNYILQTLSVGASRQNWGFARELERYSLNKKPRSGERVCAVCNSSFEVRADYSTFSNKQVVGYADARRGICEVCQAETLLRRFTLGKGTKEEGNTKFLHLYPTYFFTPITAEVMQRAYADFKQAVFSEIIRPYQQADYDLGALVHTDVFQITQPENPKRRLDLASYPEGQMHGYYLLGIPYLGRDSSETEDWVMPALLGMLSPLLFGTKAVVSDQALPPFASGVDFPETVILEAPPNYWQHAVKKTTFRLDELEAGLKTVLAFYGVTNEAYRDSRNYPIWNQLGGVARKLDSDPLAIFGYADRISSQQSKGKGSVTTTDGMTPWLAERLLTYYQHIVSYYETHNLGGKDQMGLIKETVEKYTTFYRAKSGRGKSASAYSRLRPFNIAVDTILRAPNEDELDSESLRLQISGSLLAFLDRIRAGDASITGYIPKGMSKNEVLIPAVNAFTDHMVDTVFGGYCGGERAILRKRLNQFKNGCEAFYVKEYSKKREDDDNESNTQNDLKEEV